MGLHEGVDADLDALRGEAEEERGDTLVQTHVDDAYRGRVFSLYDVIFNVAFVAAAAVAAAVLPDSGKSYAIIGVISVGYLLTALAYAHVTRRPRVSSAS